MDTPTLDTDPATAPWAWLGLTYCLFLLLVVG
jgi:hypothetical protein